MPTLAADCKGGTNCGGKNDRPREPGTNLYLPMREACMHCNPALHHLCQPILGALRHAKMQKQIHTDITAAVIRYVKKDAPPPE